MIVNKNSALFFLFILILSFASISKANAINIDSLKTVIITAGHDTTRIGAQLALIGYLEKDNLLDSALKITNKALKSCDLLLADQKKFFQIEDEIIKQKIEILLQKGNIYLKQGKLKQALEILNESKELSEEIDYKYGLAYSLYMMGDAKDYQGFLVLAMDLFKKSLKLFREIDHTRGIAISLNRLGNTYDFLGELDTALYYYTASYDVFQELNDELGKARQMNNIGIVYYLRGDYGKALGYYYKCIYLHEKHNNFDESYAITINNIGLIYENRGDILRAVEYYEKSLKAFESLGGVLASIVLPLNNLGEAYRKQGEYDKALEYFMRSLSIAKELSNVHEEAYTLDKICSIYIVINELDKAYNYCNECLFLYRRIGDKHGLALAYIGVGKLYHKLKNIDNALTNYLSSFNLYKEIGDKQGLSMSGSNIGNIYFEKGSYKNAYQYAQKSYDLANQIGSLADIQSSALLLSRIYRKQKNYEKSLQLFEEHVIIKDSVANIDIRKRLQEQYYIYQYEKKAIADSIEFAQILDIKQLELDKQRAESKKQRWIIYSVLTGLILVMGFSAVVSKLFLDKQITNKKLEISHSEINQKNEEITAQRDQITLQHEFVTEQKNLLEISHQRITDSINYAKLIQTALLPTDRLLTEKFAEQLILYKPSEIVSGDFYWIREINDTLYIIVADCTGHGVPGAFMSMLGIAFLNEITRKKNVKQTSDILNTLREEVISSLNQEVTSAKANEGIDAGILAIDKKNMKAQFSGAYSPLYLIRSNDKEIGDEVQPDRIVKKKVKDNVLYELKGDNQTIAKSNKQKSFTTLSFKLYEGDCFYLFSDGYYDQLNGLTNKRFTSQRFKNMLVQIYKQPMVEQHKILDQAFNEWKGNNEQTDDVLVVGVRL